MGSMAIGHTNPQEGLDTSPTVILTLIRLLYLLHVYNVSILHSLYIKDDLLPENAMQEKQIGAIFSGPYVEFRLGVLPRGGSGWDVLHPVPHRRKFTT